MIEEDCELPSKLRVSFPLYIDYTTIPSASGCCALLMLVGSVILSAYLGSPCIVLLDAAAVLSELLPDPRASFDRDPPSGSAASNDLDRDRVLLI